jgi:CheY-like chemotaxis protein
MMKVWLIDDDPIFRVVFRQIINEIESIKQFNEFENGQLAYNELLNHSDVQQLPNVIFLDISMPTMNGWQFLNATKGVQDELPQIAVYLISSSAPDSDNQNSQQFSYLKGHLSKPVTFEQIHTLLHA